VQLAESAPPRSESADIYPDETLDQYGEWRDDPGYGQVWMPSYAYGGYDPFAYGYWQRSGFGYSWYDPMPWSSYTFHNGYWTYLDDMNRWAWVSKKRALRQRAERASNQLDRAMDDSGSQDLERRAEAAVDELDRRRTNAPSSGLGRPIDADRRPVLQRTVDQLKSQRSAATPQSNSSSSRISSNSSSHASRAAAASNAAKSVLSRPQDP
jgi:hypothetical protein